MSANGAVRLDCDVVVLAVPSYRAAELVRPFAPSPARHLDAIPHPPIATLYLSSQQSDLKWALAGFGFLVPRTEPVRMVGCIWSSWLFPGRAPSGSVLLTVVFGGMTDPKAASLPDSALAEAAARDLEKTLCGSSSGIKRLG